MRIKDLFDKEDDVETVSDYSVYVTGICNSSVVISTPINAKIVISGLREAILKGITDYVDVDASEYVELAESIEKAINGVMTAE